jgi:hypothetical protein
MTPHSECIYCQGPLAFTNVSRLYKYMLVWKSQYLMQRMYHVYRSYYLSTPKSQSDNKIVFSSLQQHGKCATQFLLLTMARAIFD